MEETSLSVFRRKLKGDVVTRTDPDYTIAIARWAINAERLAEIVVFVKDATDVVLAIEYATEHKLPIAIRGGGHSPAGASSVKGGLVVDLSRYLNGVRVDVERQLAYTGGGALWEAVDRAAIEFGLATVGGTVNHTGVGGLILGGGYGYLSSSHGLAIDNLVQATVVTADGSILTTNQTENPDLFFGIRGGGCNFGVITEFVLRLHPQRLTVYAGTLIYSPSSLEQLVDVTTEWWPNANEKEAMLQIATSGPDGSPAIIALVFYNGSEAEGRENYKRFLEIGPVADTTREIPYEELNALQNPWVGHGSGVYMKGVAQKKPSFATISKAFNRAVDIMENNDFKINTICEYFPLNKICSVSNGTTAFRRDPTPTILILINWKGRENLVENNDKARVFAHEIAGIVLKEQPDISDSQRLGYGNYDSEAVKGEKDEVPNKAKLVFAENYPRLQRIKKRYDPENIFNKWFPITPA